MTALVPGVDRPPGVLPRGQHQQRPAGDAEHLLRLIEPVEPSDEAEGRREAAFRDAEAREREAEAEAKATQMVSDAIAGGNAQAINYFIAQKYVEAVSQFATSPNAKTILFPVEATQLIGTLGGIGELAKDALERKGA